jgi:hypothetical protein
VEPDVALEEVHVRDAEMPCPAKMGGFRACLRPRAGTGGPIAIDHIARAPEPGQETRLSPEAEEVRSSQSPRRPLSADVTTELPMVAADGSSVPRRRDLARGWNVLLFWGGPLAWIIGSSLAGPLLHLSFTEFGSLLMVGTAWFGGICLLNALRCGRVHCWIDGTLLPALAVVGGLNLAGLIAVSWSSYLSALWLILLASILVECIVGSYPRTRAP